MVQSFDAFPSLFVYGVWWARNSTIFQDHKIPIEITSVVIVQWSREHKKVDKQKRICLIKDPSIDKRIP